MPSGTPGATVTGPSSKLVAIARVIAARLSAIPASKNTPAATRHTRKIPVTTANMTVTSMVTGGARREGAEEGRGEEAGDEMETREERKRRESRKPESSRRWEREGRSEQAGRLWMYVALKTWERSVGNLLIYETAVLLD